MGEDSIDQIPKTLLHTLTQQTTLLRLSIWSSSRGYRSIRLLGSFIAIVPTSDGVNKGIARRKKKVLKDNIMGITKPSIRRLARRGGVVRISDGIYEETRVSLKTFLTESMDHQNRKTVTVIDAIHALKSMGNSLMAYKNISRTSLKGDEEHEQGIKSDDNEESGMQLGSGRWNDIHGPLRRRSLTAFWTVDQMRAEHCLINE
ncbi:hypothetical protein DOTSEDRAFT_37537 [Dothistroma septosporum NZE10]|uniref:Histone H4 n=1 Tax=Dothistroma septosporum (strain NZE10 / CBS 128990) TaxID=675120 RepID=N1PGX4_DOTSN|nr:hypothetical protein DOTSEDRAFT_37537 [Dothistroma septosporum NZE10]